jgi:hypothetical protein
VLSDYNLLPHEDGINQRVTEKLNQFETHIKAVLDQRQQ